MTSASEIVETAAAAPPPRKGLAAALDRYFELGAMGTNIRTEVLAGVTTFLTMAYIVVVNPLILGEAGMSITAVAVATCLSAALGTILMGVWARYPMALAPGMGLNAYFTYTVVKGMGLSWQLALGSVFVSGAVFLLLTLAGVRQLIVAAIPRPLFSAIAAAVGLFIAFIGFRNAGLVVADPDTLVKIGSFKGATPLLALFGLALTAALGARKAPGAILIGILGVTAVAFAVGATSFKPQALHLADVGATAFKLDILGAIGVGRHSGPGLIEILFVFLFVDLFGNVGTLVAVCQKIGVLREDGTVPRLNRILIVDSIATMVGAAAGTSSVVSYVESASGVSAGGKTGLTALVTGLLFLAALPLAPLVQAIPTAATAPALILVGAMMMSCLADIDWHDPGVAVPAFLTVIVTPLTFSIADGMAFGVVSYALLKLVRGKAGREDLGLFGLAALFVARDIYIALI